MQRRILIIIAVAFLLCGCSSKAEPKNILVLTERGGQHESFAVAALEWLDGFAAENGYALTVINNTAPITEQYLDNYDLFLQLDFPPYTWSDESKQAFEEYIDQGKGGWVGMHHATLLGDFDGWPMWEWFSDFMGGIRFRNYIAPLADGDVRVEAQDHPVMKGVSPIFTVRDEEWYTFDVSPRGNVKVLSSVDEDSYSPASDVRMGDHPAVWVNESKKARNVYFLMGHAGVLFESADFARMFSNAIHWALGDEDKL